MEVMDAAGRRLSAAKLPEGIAGMARFHAMIAAQLDPDADLDAQAGQVLIGIETDRGPWVQALIAAGYRVYAVNPLQAARYRGGWPPRRDHGVGPAVGALAAPHRHHHGPGRPRVRGPFQSVGALHLGEQRQQHHRQLRHRILGAGRVNADRIGSGTPLAGAVEGVAVVLGK